MTLTESTKTGTPKGWYPDPDDEAEWRYWDGERWTDQRSPRTGSPAKVAAPASPTSTIRATASAAKVPMWIVLLAAAALIGGVVWWVNDSGSPAPSVPGVEQTDTNSNNPSVGGGDDAVRAGVDAIARACSAFAGQYGRGPSVDDVSPYGGVAEFVSSWPTNPFTGEPMTQSNAPGDFTFATATRMPDGRYVGYVTGILESGQTYAVEYQY